MSHYCYQPLPPIAKWGMTPPFTRLMLLAPGNGLDPLVCSLTIVDIQNAPQYEALSYVWGHDLASQPVWCEGGFIPIKSNLDVALRNLRLPGQSRRLWVDALCIDQGNTSERTRQVGYMRLVYKHAARTIVWLGLKSPGIEEVFQLAELVADLKSVHQPSPSAGSLPADEPATDESMLELPLITEVFNAHLETVTRLMDFFERQYFMRIWCVQEIVVSSWCTAKCEDLEVNFMSLLSTIIHVYMRRSSFLTGQPFQCWNFLYMLKQPGRSNVPNLYGHEIEGSVGPLRFLLASTRDFQATDARDKVFSLLGISDEGLMPVLGQTTVFLADSDSLMARLWRQVQRRVANRAERLNETRPGKDFGRNRALKADYSKSTVEVYRDLTRFLMRSSRGMLGVLSHVQHIEDPSTSDTFPSWVPKWHQPWSASIIGDVGFYVAGMCNGHSRSFATIHDNHLSRPSVRPDILSIGGYYVDQVISVSPVFECAIGEELPIQAAWSHLFDAPFSQLAPHPYRTGEILQMAFCQSLQAGWLGSALNRGPESVLRVAFTPNLKDRFTQQAHADAAAYVLLCLSDCHPLTSVLESLQHAAARGSSVHYTQGARIICHSRRVYMTQKGFLGIGPKIMKNGDEVCVLFGGRVPYILRPVQDHHVFIGETYVHDEDVMLGKLITAVQSHKQLPTVTYEIK
ncbi:MAG: hypothetical protein Q9208_008608 [Pyrenodesmia sp. 3 TL-2023]